LIGAARSASREGDLMSAAANLRTVLSRPMPPLFPPCRTLLP